ncbi:MAG: metal-dependent hydrolase [Vicinamibacterales bacterium]
MDNLCHTLAGAALGEAGLKRRTALGMGTLLIASNLPDIDVAVFATDTVWMSFRRGWTHGVLAMVVLPALLAGLMLAFDRLRNLRSGGSSAFAPSPADRRSLGGGWLDPPAGRRAHLRSLLLLAYLGTSIHVFMDFLNSYGVRLLMPFSNRWFYGDALYIIDPVLYLVFGVAFAAARVMARRNHPAPWRPARIGLALAGAYVVVMLTSNLWAREVVRDGLSRAGRSPDTRFMVTPVFGNPLRREVIVETGDRYEKGLVWFEPQPHFRPAGFGVDINQSDPAVRQAIQTPPFQAFLRWSRFPFYVIERTATYTRVHLNDYRYSSGSGRDGWAAMVAEVP